MSVKLKNLTNRPVLLRLNSGRTLHLGPRATSSEITDVEVNNNDKVKKLQARRVIGLQEVVENEQPLREPIRDEEIESSEE